MSLGEAKLVVTKPMKKAGNCTIEVEERLSPVLQCVEVSTKTYCTSSCAEYS